MSDITLTAGETLILDIAPVTRPVVDNDGVLGTEPVDLTLADTKLWFEIGDAIMKTYGVQGQDGITIHTGGDKNTGVIEVESSATALLTRLRYPWQLKLEEPGGRDTVLDHGSVYILS